MPLSLRLRGKSLIVVTCTMSVMSFITPVFAAGNALTAAPGFGQAELVFPALSGTASSRNDALRLDTSNNVFFYIRDGYRIYLSDIDAQRYFERYYPAFYHEHSDDFYENRPRFADDWHEYYGAGRDWRDHHHV